MSNELDTSYDELVKRLLLSEQTPFDELVKCLRENRPYYDQKGVIVDYRQEDLARDINYGVKTVQNIERGVVQNPSRYAEKLASALQIPSEFYPRFLERAYDFERPVKPPKPRDNPYMGLRTFQAEDADYFFGRETVADQYVAQLAKKGAPRFLAVVGESGIGKSSIVRAGVVPMLLKNSGLPGGRRPVVCIVALTETHDYSKLMGVLAENLEGVAQNKNITWDMLIPKLQGGTDGLVDAAKMILRHENTPLLLVIDQFEQIFNQVSDETVRDQLMDILYTAVTASDSPVWIIVTLRSDFYHFVRSYKEDKWRDLVPGREEWVEPLLGSDLDRAIRRPALLSDIHLEDELVKELKTEVREQPGALPLLQYALFDLVEKLHKKRQSSLLTKAEVTKAEVTKADFESGGGIKNYLNWRGTEIYEKLTEAQKKETRQLFLRLVTVGDGERVKDTRRRVLRSELEKAARNKEALNKVIDRFGNERFLTFGADPADPDEQSATVEIAHEALLRNWNLLSSWLDQSRSDLLVYRRLQSEASGWKTYGDESYLASGIKLIQFEKSSERLRKADIINLTADEWMYLDASEKAQEKAEQELKAANWREFERVKKVEQSNEQVKMILIYTAVVVIMVVTAVVIVILIRRPG